MIGIHHYLILACFVFIFGCRERDAHSVAKDAKLTEARVVELNNFSVFWHYDTDPSYEFDEFGAPYATIHQSSPDAPVHFTYTFDYESSKTESPHEYYVLAAKIQRRMQKQSPILVCLQNAAIVADSVCGIVNNDLPFETSDRFATLRRADRIFARTIKLDLDFVHSQWKLSANTKNDSQLLPYSVNLDGENHLKFILEEFRWVLSTFPDSNSIPLCLERENEKALYPGFRCFRTRNPFE